MIIIIVLTATILIIWPNISAKNNSDYILNSIITILCLGIFAISIFNLSYNSGVKDGAYNQLRGRYEVTYVINKDSCVIDTIINLE